MNQCRDYGQKKYNEISIDQGNVPVSAGYKPMKYMDTTSNK